MIFETCDYADIRDYYRRKRAGEDMTGYTPPGTITEPPEQFSKWVAANSDRLERAEKRGTTPYFIANNAKYAAPNLKPGKATPAPEPRPKTPLEIAAERHARRTAEEEQKIKERWSSRELDNQISEVMEKAKQAGESVQLTAEKIAHRHGAVVTPINYKSRDSIRRKVLAERTNPETPDFAPSELKDAVRNTIIASKQSLVPIIKELQSSKIFMRYKPQHTELGYVGNIINVRTSQGIIGEIQVNTPAMIYAKEPPEIAKSIIGDDVWRKIHRQTNVPGGLGHKYYEEWRVMSIEEQQSERGQKLLRKSLEYYAIFAKL